MSGVMKKPEDYLKEQHISEWVLEYLSGMLQPDGISGNYKQRIFNAIKLAQLDAIDATVKLCAEKASVDFYIEDDWERIYFVNKDSILNCAEILKKGL